MAADYLWVLVVGLIAGAVSGIFGTGSPVMLLTLPPGLADLALGMFFLAMVPVRRLLQRAHVCLRLWQLVLAGAVLGFVTGIVVSTGPLSVPAFAEAGALPAGVALSGLIVGAALMAGTFAGKRLVLRPSPALQLWLIDGLLPVSGIALLAAAWRA